MSDKKPTREELLAAIRRRMARKEAEDREYWVPLYDAIMWDDMPVDDTETNDVVDPGVAP